MTIALVAPDRRSRAACSPGSSASAAGSSSCRRWRSCSGLTQLHAEASSLLAILPTALVGTWRQRRYGNVDLTGAALIGVAAIAGWRAGCALAEALPEGALRRALRRPAPGRAPRRSPGGRAADREHFSRWRDEDDIWIPLVDEPIGSIVAQLQAEHPEIDRLVSRPHQHPRVPDVRLHPRRAPARPAARRATTCPTTTGPRPGSRRCCAIPEHHQAVVAELRAVAEEIAADPRYADDEPIGPDEAARERFRDVRPRAARVRARLRNPRALAESGTVPRRLALLLPLALLAFGSAGAAGPAHGPGAQPRRAWAIQISIAGRRDRRRRRPSPRRPMRARSPASAFAYPGRRLDRLRSSTTATASTTVARERRPRRPRPT